MPGNWSCSIGCGYRGTLRTIAASGPYLAGADFETTFRVISAAFGDRDLDVLLGVARERHGPWAELIIPRAIVTQFGSFDDNGSTSAEQ